MKTYITCGLLATALLLITLEPTTVTAAVAANYNTLRDRYGYKLIDIDFSQTGTVGLQPGILAAHRINRAFMRGRKIIKISVDNLHSKNDADAKVATTFNMYFMRNQDDLDTKYKFLQLVGASGASPSDNLKWGTASATTLLTTSFKYFTDGANAEGVTQLYGFKRSSAWGNVGGVSLVAVAPVNSIPRLLLGKDAGAADTRVVLDGFYYRDTKAYKLQLHTYNSAENEAKTVELTRLREKAIGIRERSDRDERHNDTILNEKMDFGMIIGIAIGCLAAGVLLVVCVGYFKK